MEEIKIVCRECKAEKGVNDMKKDPRCKNGVEKVCHDCENLKNKNRYAKKLNDEEWRNKERERAKKYREEHKDEMNKRKREERKEKENEYFACGICRMLVKNLKIHEKSEYHDKNKNNSWKEPKEKYYFEIHQMRIKELKKMYEVWQKDLEIEKEKMAQEKKEEDKKKRKQEYDKTYRAMKQLKKRELGLEVEDREKKEKEE